MGGIETAVVKVAKGRMAAECLPPEESQKRIYEAAHRAVSRLRSGQAPQPLGMEAPIRVTVELVTSDMADRVEVLPDALRLDDKRIAFTVDDAPTAYRVMRAAVGLAKG